MDKQQRGLDMGKIKLTKPSRTLEESLKDIVPIKWTDEVMVGKTKVIIGK